MSRIPQNLQEIRESLPETARLIVVSKYREVSEIMEVYNCGQREFAENRVQALLERADQLPGDISWHLIGHLQTNKVKYIAPFIAMIHSVDSLKLLMEINKQAEKCNRSVDCLLQIFVAQEETKFGFTPEEVLEFLEEGSWKNLRHVRITGLMAMATQTTETGLIRAEFETVKTLFQKLKNTFFTGHDEFRELSMGMSSDYKIALACGSTMVRIGSTVFE